VEEEDTVEQPPEIAAEELLGLDLAPISTTPQQVRYPISSSTACFLSQNPNVAVLGRNRTLFCCVFRSHYHIRSAV